MGGFPLASPGTHPVVSKAQRKDGILRVLYKSTFDKVFTLESEIAIAIFLVVLALMATCLVLFRASRRKEATHKSEWTLVEGSYVVAVLCMAVFLVWLSLTSNAHEKAAASEKPALVVKVLGYQWCWQFMYVGHDATVQGTCNLGHTLPTLVLPEGERVKFELESNDVVHEFWLPYLDYKVELFPHHVNTFTARFTQTGRWEGRCAEFCGLYHDDMEFWVHVESKSAYRKWLADHHGYHRA
jgi:cytochrome c oxidase subunit 2